eukprot:5153925-Pleurochrysis_carterae.AAC.2
MIWCENKALLLALRHGTIPLLRTQKSHGDRRLRRVLTSSSAAVARTCFSSSRCFSLSPLLTVSTMLLSSASIVFVGFRLGTRSVGGLLSADEPRDGARWPSARSPAEECPRTTVLVVVVVTDCEPVKGRGTA